MPKCCDIFQACFILSASGIFAVSRGKYSPQTSPHQASYKQGLATDLGNLTLRQNSVRKLWTYLLFYAIFKCHFYGPIFKEVEKDGT